MSKLNVYHHELRPNEYAEFYLKYEADNVIAELKDKLDIYKRGWEENDKINANLYAQLRHSKYKRCLAMASTCRLRARWFGDNAFYKKEQWALQWHRRWLELAEKFKPNEEAKYANQ